MFLDASSVFVFYPRINTTAQSVWSKEPGDNISINGIGDRIYDDVRSVTFVYSHQGKVQATAVRAKRRQKTRSELRIRELESGCRDFASVAAELPSVNEERNAGNHGILAKIVEFLATPKIGEPRRR